MKKAVLLALIVLSLSVQNAAAENPFAVFAYDPASEKQLGAFPTSRDTWARAVTALAQLDAKAVVFKFFFDLPKTPSEDNALASAMKKLPTILQACIDETEAMPNPAETRFAISLATVPSRIMKGKHGWLPLPAFCAAAQGLGFVDIRQPDSIPMVVEYDGKVYRSLWLLALQLVLPDLAMDGKSLRYRDRSIKLNSYGEATIRYPKKDYLEYRSVADLLNGKVGKAETGGKVAIVIYDGENQGFMKTPIGDVKAHRAFCYALVDLYRQLTE